MGLLARLGLEPMPVPIWRPRDALPVRRLPCHVTQRYREAAERLEFFAAEHERKLGSVMGSAPRLSSEDVKASSGRSVVIIGNQHSMAKDGKHAWRLYVAGCGASNLSKVDVWLHPTFQQNHFTLDGMPFELPCTGWGTFDICLRLHKKAGGHVDATWPLQFDEDDAHTVLEL